MNMAVRCPAVVQLRLPRMSGSEALQSNLLAAAAGVVSLTIGATLITVRLAPRPKAESLAADWRVNLKLASHPLSLSCNHGALSRLLRTLEPALVLDPRPPASILALLVETLLHTLLPSLQRALHEPVVFASIDAVSECDRGVALEISIGEQIHHAVLDGGEAIDRILAAWSKRQNALAAVRVPTWLRLGSSVLTIGILASLRLGDAVLVETHHGGQFAVQFAGGWQAAARTLGNGVTLLEKPAPWPHADKETRMPPNEGLDIDTLPVRLDFDVGHRELSLAELKVLQAGAVLSLGRPATELVEITVHGRRIGCGELVEVDGVPAVRIVRLFGLD